MPARYPERIVCLTEESTETLYLLGEERRIVGISGYTVRPPRARREKPRVSAFLSAKNDKIVALKPDLVIGFSDLQADIARDLVKAGLNVLIFNQRSVDEILSMILTLASLVGASAKGERLVAELEAGLAGIRAAAARFARRPRVYFEEWDEPMISGIGWVSELVGIAGGADIFPERARSHAAAGRTVADPQEVVRARPDVILGSWCGKKFRPERVAARPGWAGRARGARRRAARDQVRRHPAAGPGSAHRRRAPHARDLRRLGGAPGTCRARITVATLGVNRVRPRAAPLAADGRCRRLRSWNRLTPGTTPAATARPRPARRAAGSRPPSGPARSATSARSCRSCSPTSRW